MLQNPETKKKEKYHLRPRFATADSSARSAPASGGGILTWAGIAPVLMGDSFCIRIFDHAVSKRFGAVPKRIARSSVTDSYSVQVETTCRHGNESHRRPGRGRASVGGAEVKRLAGGARLDSPKLFAFYSPCDILRRRQ